MKQIEIMAASKIHNGRILIPKEIREKYNFKDGNKIVWIVDDRGHLTIRDSRFSDEIITY